MRLLRLKVHPKSSTNVFVSSQRQPPRAPPFLRLNTKLRRFCFHVRWRVGERNGDSETDREKVRRQRWCICRWDLKQRNLGRWRFYRWWSFLFFSPLGFYFLSCSSHILPEAESIGNESLPVTGLLALWALCVLACDPEQDGIKSDWKCVDSSTGAWKKQHYTNQSIKTFCQTARQSQNIHWNYTWKHLHT